MPDSDWCITANIIRERPFGPGGSESRAGTKHFRAGAKVFVIGLYAGMVEDVVVIGRHRGSRRYVRMVVRARWLTNLRLGRVYSPTARRLVDDAVSDGHPKLTEKEAREMLVALPHWGAGA
ncbi:MAG: hypothetical protein KC731_28555 [Myxococcales bacterium]|nr:hypothetical protein [Myxococcales bacterium]